MPHNACILTRKDHQRLKQLLLFELHVNLERTSIKHFLRAQQRILTALGEQIRLARLRRRFSAVIISERAGISRNTLRAIERGDPTVSFGSYASVLLSLSLEKDLLLVAKDDLLGRKLQDANLSTKARAPRIMKARRDKKQ